MSSYTTHVSLLQRLSSGCDQSAWTEFHDRYGLLIRRIASRQGLQAADCDDVVQDVLTSLASSMPGFEYDPKKGMFRAYLKTITLRALQLRHKRKKGSRAAGGDVMVEVPMDDAELERHWEEEWRQYHLRRAMAAINSEFNPIDRAAFEHYAIHSESADATAEKLGISKAQVYQAKSRILKRLEEVIEIQVQEEG